ncbi:glycosyltransferase [Aequorivita sp. H23M31]|uniref:Glycosyltransferase n=1 Tax=Aequorivita ciconiae TaxID=2494375 RepID=A0A410G3E5_9FLAO|nr:glycosyltransferase [Aequorivita sp. H23M31]QAA81818.1 glycosyltransferase [Aequorivita sp. H23M31]
MKKILVAPLNWGLGHATRCIPIILQLLEHDFKVLIASDGSSLRLLQMEFPNLDFLELPSYKIKYTSNGRLFKWKMISSLSRISRTMKAEEKLIAEMVSRGEIDGIISDSRLGVRNAAIPSIYITHQLNVFTGSTSHFSSYLHRQIIKKFDSCWVPDVKDMAMNYSGSLGHLIDTNFPVRYFGIVSRLQKKNLPKTIDILVIISGPEPQRGLFETKLKEVLSESDKKIVMVQGIVEAEQIWTKHENIDVVNFMRGEELERCINESALIISRSGYTTIMDLAYLEKKVFFVPTPGQYEQEYLAKRLNDMGIAPYCKQRDFTLEKLKAVPVYKGLKFYTHTSEEFSGLFSIFHSKGKFRSNA